jgi:hypothetical protein
MAHRVGPRRGSRSLLCADLECPGPLSCLVGMQAVSKALPVGDDGVAAWPIVASHVQDETAASRTQRGRFTAEAAGPPEQLQILGANAEPDPSRGIQPAYLFHYRIDHCADERVHRHQLPIAQGAELLDHVDGRPDVLMADDLGEHSPRLVTENPGLHSLSRKKCQALGLESIHAEHSPGQRPRGEPTRLAEMPGPARPTA